MTVATTMNVREVACMKPAAQAWVRPTARAYSAAGPPRTTSSATRNTGTRTIARVLADNADMSRPAPVLTKNTGIKNPKPIASSLTWNCSWVVGDSPVRRTMIPARNAPKMVASPKRSATTPNARANVMASRTPS